MRVKNQKDFLAGLLFMAVGLAFAWGATHYPIGRGAHMGPGYFPLVLGALLAFIGALVVFKAAVIQTEGGNKVGPWAWRPLLCILGANFTFGILLAGLPSLGIPSLGLVAAIYALTFIASLASGPLRFLEVFILACVLAVGSSLAFVELLQLQLPLWPAFVAG